MQFQTKTVTIESNRFIPDLLRVRPPFRLRFFVRSLGSLYSSLFAQQDRFLIIYIEELDLQSPPLTVGASFQVEVARESSLKVIALNVPRMQMRVQAVECASLQDFVKEGETYSKAPKMQPLDCTTIRLQEFKEQFKASIDPADFDSFVGDSRRVLPSFDKVVLEQSSALLVVKSVSQDETSGSQELGMSRKRGKHRRKRVRRQKQQAQTCRLLSFLRQRMQAASLLCQL